MTKPYVLGIDPGVSTGVAFAYYNHDTGEWVYTTTTCQDVAQVWDYVKSPVTVVVVERFAASLINKYGLHTVEVVGGVVALAYTRNMLLVRDTPAQRKPYMEYAKAHVPTRTHLSHHELRHEIDALSHVIRYLYKEGHITSLRV